jgi:hypothetical protein
MKIDPAAPQRPSTARRAGGAGPARSDGFAKALSEEGTTAGGVSGSAPIGVLDAMLAAQEVPDATEGRRRARRRGEDILDRLEEIRLGLLLGTVSQARLQQLAQALRSARGQVDDPRLDEILDEIELRAAVELAKLAR